MGCTTSMAVAPEPACQKAPKPGAVEPTTKTRGRQEYTFHEVLGQGSFGVVHTATQRSTGMAVAVKAVDLLGRRPQQRRAALEEVEVWRCVGSHPNLVELHESFMEMQCLYIVMEVCQCNVIEWLCDTFDTSQARMPWIMRELLLGLQACHQANVVHRDIKPENYLVSRGGTRIMLSDFGLAARLPSKGGLRGACGTRPMNSPEMLLNRRYSTGTDIWSFGVSVYFLFFGELPYAPEDDSHEAMRRAVVKGRAPRRLHDEPLVGFEAKEDFLRPLLRPDPRRRASVEQALKLPFLQPARSQPDELPAKQGGNPGSVQDSTQVSRSQPKKQVAKQDGKHGSAQDNARAAGSQLDEPPAKQGIMQGSAPDHAQVASSRPDKRPANQGGKQGSAQDNTQGGAQGNTQETMAPMDSGDLSLDLDNDDEAWSLGSHPSK